MQEIKAYAAQQLHSLGYNCMPLRSRSKRPALPEWKIRQTTRLNRLELQRLFRKDYELAIITGELDETGVNVLGIDFDSPEEFEAWEGPPSNMIEQTQHGFHALYQLPSGKRVPNKVGVGGREMDYRHQGGYLKVSPSESDSGFVYRWVKGPVPAKDLVFLPDEFIQEHREEPVDKPTIVDRTVTAVRRTIIRSVSNPERYVMRINSVQGSNGSAGLVRAVCVLRDAGRTMGQAFEFLRGTWNLSNAVPPWSDEELARAIRRHYGAA